MSAKAGKFTLQAGDITVPPGNNGFAVNGVGFRPQIVVLMTVGLTSENSWKTVAGIDGGMAIFSENTVSSPGITTGLTETWDSNIKPASFWSDTGVIWFRGQGGAAIYLAGVHDDGFYVGYPGGFEGGYGMFCYYLAIAQEDAQVAQMYGYEGVSPAAVGFEPDIYMVLGSGGLSSGTGAIAFADFDVPSWGFGGFDNQKDSLVQTEWMANGLAHGETVEQQRWFLDGDGDQWVMDGFTASQILGNTAYYYGRSATEFSIGTVDGFPGGDFTRVGVHFMSDALYAGSVVTPPPVGSPVDVDVGISPECVIFLGPQTNHGNLFGIPWGGRCFGFLTADFQCCIAFGAQQRASDNDPIGRVASFCSSDIGWISNFTSDEVADPSNPNYGTAELLPGGFRLDTLAMPKTNQYLRYVAYGFEEEAPGFFRVVYR
jgi:hypothetical protein